MKKRSASYSSRRPPSRVPMRSFCARTSIGRIFSPNNSFRQSCLSALRSSIAHRPQLKESSKCSPTSPGLTSRIRELRAAAMSCRTPHSRWPATRVPNDRRGRIAWSSAPCSSSTEVSSSRRTPSTALTKMPRLTYLDRPASPMSCAVS